MENYEEYKINTKCVSMDSFQDQEEKTLYFLFLSCLSPSVTILGVWRSVCAFWLMLYSSVFFLVLFPCLPWVHVPFVVCHVSVFIHLFSSRVSHFLCSLCSLSLCLIVCLLFSVLLGQSRVLCYCFASYLSHRVRSVPAVFPSCFSSSRYLPSSLFQS